MITLVEKILVIKIRKGNGKVRGVKV